MAQGSGTLRNDEIHNVPSWFGPCASSDIIICHLWPAGARGNWQLQGDGKKRGSLWSKWNRLRELSKRPWRPFRPEEKPYVIIHEFLDNDINNLEKKINMFRASKRMNFRPTKRSSSDLDLDDLPNTKRFRATKRVPEFVLPIAEDDIDNVKRQNSMFFRASK